MLNKVILMGRLTADPEIKQTTNGISVSSFSIAVDRSYAAKGAQRQTDFINIVAWRQTAEFISRYFSKGQMIALEGSIQMRNYEDKQGNKRVAFEVVADQVHFCGSKNESTSRPAAANYAEPPKFEEPAKSGENFSVGEFDEFDGFEEIGTDDSELPF